ncbi:Actin-related protein 2/3 complex subunit 2B [Capsicum annuum]|nr:Actin-related protein 2/3 complex subunit 2B [Capsicum annuum]
MACFERASPALKEILLRLYRPAYVHLGSFHRVPANFPPAQIPNNFIHQDLDRWEEIIGIRLYGRIPFLGLHLPFVLLSNVAFNSPISDTLYDHKPGIVDLPEYLKGMSQPPYSEVSAKLAPLQKRPAVINERAIDADHHLHEFGSVEYYIQSLVSDPDHTYLSVSTPILSQAFLISTRLSHYTIEKVKAISAEVVEIVQPPKEGYQLTLRLNFARMSHGKESIKMITDIAAVQGVILSSQLEEMLMNVNSQDVAQGMYKPIKLVYHPREPFYVIKQPQKITAVFPMRFKEKTDVIIATAFFQFPQQELMDVANTKACAKAPHCIWSPIPPPELRGEAIEDLSTNGGFVSFDITSRHIEGKRLDKTVWNLLNFYAFVKNHVKVLQKTGLQDDQHIKAVKGRTWEPIAFPSSLALPG